ncbi:MAG TPA: NnrU family protein [Usitatibacteraceae bacterium]
MAYLIIGLLLFLGVHSVRVFADDWRAARIAGMGANAWKGAYSLVALAGFVLIVYGYGLSRQAPVDLWMPPLWARDITIMLTLPIFILLAAAYVPGTNIKARLKHPMVLSVKLWAFAHLLSNGRLGDVLLFGGFLLWSMLAFRAARQRDRQQGLSYPAIGVARDFIAIAIGLAAWLAFAFYLHGALIGVRPLG